MSAIEDYLQLVAKGSPLNNQWQQLKHNINQNIPQASDVHDPAKMQEWAINAALNVPMLGNILAWHGSPHKFSKFSDKAIGSGEGAQAFGMGHYSATDPATADKFYRKRLADNLNADLNDGLEHWATNNSALERRLKAISDANIAEQPFVRDYDPVRLKLFQMQQHNSNLSDLWGRAQRHTALLHSNPELQAIIESMRAHKIPPPSPGYLYQLNLRPNKEDLLNFDTPLSEQSPGILEALKTAGADRFNITGLSERTGESAFRKLEQSQGTNIGKLLDSLGVPGHSFNGQGGDGLPNFVIYDPKNIEVIRRIRAGMDNPSSAAGRWAADLSSIVNNSQRGAYPSAYPVRPLAAELRNFRKDAWK